MTVSTACSCSLGVCTVGVTGTSNYNGAASFDYTVTANSALSNTSTATLTIDSVNDLPVIGADQTFNIDDQGAFLFTLNTASDSDVPAQTLSYKIINSIGTGTLSGCIDSLSYSTDRTCIYTPGANTNGTFSFTYRVSDGVDESLGDATVTFNVTDLTPPNAPSVVLHSNLYSNSTNVTLTNQTCSDIGEIFVSLNATPPTAGSAWQACNTTAGGYSQLITAPDGVKTIYVFSRDINGNIQSVPTQVQMTFDTTPPVITAEINNIKPSETKTISFNITEVNSSNVQNITFDYHDGTSWSTQSVAMVDGPINNKEFSTNITAPVTEGTNLQILITYADLAGNSTTETYLFKTDSVIPYMNVFSLNGGVTATGNNSVLSEIDASDANSPITHFCIKYNDPSQPAESSTCWNRVDGPTPNIAPTQNIYFNNHFYRVGYVKTTYNVYAWVKDEAGNISTNSNTLGVDRFDISYDPGNAPTINNLEVTNTDSPNSPNLPSELTASAGDNIYVKWHADDLEGLSANPISVYYTINDVDYIPFPSEQNISNGVNAACTIDARFTGCTVVTAPSSSYFKVRVVAKDLVDSIVFYKSGSLNDTSVKVIAGNSEDGIGASATTAVFPTYGAASTSSYVYKYKLVMTNSGKLFYADTERGILWVNPDNGVLEVLIPDTNSSTGDGGPVSGATLNYVSAIALDKDDNIVFRDNRLIRKVDLSTMTVSTLIGGGALVEPTTTVAASDIELEVMDPRLDTFITLPNGDLIFADKQNSLTKRRYRASDGMVEPIELDSTGVGVGTYASDPWEPNKTKSFGVAFDKGTSEIKFMMQTFYKKFTGDTKPYQTRIDHTSGNSTTAYSAAPPYDISFANESQYTGEDGNIYFLSRYRTSIHHYDYVNNTRSLILGDGSIPRGLCVDGTPAISCSVDVTSIFVASDGQIYFSDQGTIRTIDSSGNVLTIFGQDKSFGNGGLATAARLGTLVVIQNDKPGANDNNLVLFDGNSHQLRQFQIGGNITKLTDLGYSWHGPDRFEIDTVSGDILSPKSISGHGIGRFDRIGGTWSKVVGGGATAFYNGEGIVGSDISHLPYLKATNGFVNNVLFHTTHNWNGSNSEYLNTKMYDATDQYRQSHFLGTSLYGTSVTPGSLLADQSMSPTNIEFFQDPNDGFNKFFFGRLGSSYIYTGELGGNLESFVDLGNGIYSYAYRNDGDLRFYYCSTGSNQLYEYNYTTGIKTHLSWNSPSLICDSKAQNIIFNSERNSIIFQGIENGFGVIAEYSL